MMLLVLQLGLIVGARTLVGVGWGHAPVQHPDGTLLVGWMTNPSDSFFYASWLQQARAGHDVFSNLYTTTPHLAGYFNPLFWGVGRLSALTGLPPEAGLIGAGTLAALLLGTGVYTLSWRLSGQASPAFWAGFIAIFSSGWTWIQRVAAKAFG